jgi:dTDP-4-amino-4,6-dideoxygalactose transaminase
MTGRVYLSAPDVGAMEERYVLDAIRSGWVAPLGPSVDAFEREIAERVGVGHAVGLNSGTAALHLALLGLGVGPSDAVIVPTLTFAATANAVVYTGAEPVFVDCDSATGNLDPVLLADLLAQLRREGRRVGAVLTVDLFGRCADYASILPLCVEYGAPVIEDAAEALGATYRGASAGSFGQAAVLSFNGNKIMTTSGGGMLLSDDARLAVRARYLASQARQPVVHYEHTDVGYNYRLSNVLAALGRAQLLRLGEMIERRRRLRERYAKLLAGVDGVCILGDDDNGANCWLTSIIVEPAEAGWRVAELAAYLAALDIETRPVWKPMHLQPIFAGARAALTGAAERLFVTGLVLPSGSALGEAEIGRVFDAIERFLGGSR